MDPQRKHEVVRMLRELQDGFGGGPAAETEPRSQAPTMPAAGPAAERLQNARTSGGEN